MYIEIYACMYTIPNTNNIMYIHVDLLLEFAVAFNYFCLCPVVCLNTFLVIMMLKQMSSLLLANSAYIT